jgi:hypothetical protein
MQLASRALDFLDRVNDALPLGYLVEHLKAHDVPRGPLGVGHGFVAMSEDQSAGQVLRHVGHEVTLGAPIKTICAIPYPAFARCTAQSEMWNRLFR